MSKHTPKPWGIVPAGPGEPDNDIIAHPPGDDEGRLVATVRDTADTEGSANVHLISAAPDLLDALETAIRWLRRLEREHPGCLNDDAIEKHLEKAVAKARGG